jgi:hypothetical protein
MDSGMSISSIKPFNRTNKMLEIETKKFELRIILSVMNDSNMVGTTETEKAELVNHLTPDLDHDRAIEILSENETLVKAARLIDGVNLDRGRYNKLMDLYRGSHSFPHHAAAVAA